MMSKERELLRRVRDTLRELKETHYDLYWDIQTALDQPEQEPIAWMVETSFNGKPISEFYKVKPATRTCKYCKVTELYKGSND